MTAGDQTWPRLAFGVRVVSVALLVSFALGLQPLRVLATDPSGLVPGVPSHLRFACANRSRTTLPDGACGSCDAEHLEDSSGKCLALYALPRPGMVANVTATPPVAASPLDCTEAAPHPPGPTSFNDFFMDAHNGSAVRIGARILVLFVKPGWLTELNINSMQLRQRPTTGPMQATYLGNFTVTALDERYAVVVGGFVTFGDGVQPAPNLVCVLDAATMAWSIPHLEFVTSRIQRVHGAGSTAFTASTMYITGGGYGVDASNPSNSGNETYRLSLVQSPNGPMTVQVQHVKGRSVKGRGLPSRILNPILTTTTVGGRVALVLHGGQVVRVVPDSRHQTTTTQSTATYYCFPQDGFVDWVLIQAPGNRPNPASLSFGGPPMGAMVNVRGHDLWYQFPGWHNRACRDCTRALNMTSFEWETIQEWAVDGQQGAIKDGRPLRCLAAPPPYSATADACNRPLYGGREPVLATPQLVAQRTHCVVYCLTSTGVPVFIPETHEWRGTREPVGGQFSAEQNLSPTAVGSNMVLSLGQWKFDLYSSVSRTWRTGMACASCTRFPSNDTNVIVKARNDVVYAVGLTSGALCSWANVPTGPLLKTVDMTWVCSSAPAPVASRRSRIPMGSTTMATVGPALVLVATPFHRVGAEQFQGSLVAYVLDTTAPITTATFSAVGSARTLPLGYDAQVSATSQGSSIIVLVSHPPGAPGFGQGAQHIGPQPCAMDLFALGALCGWTLPNARARFN